jgi:hypothetical protein
MTVLTTVQSRTTPGRYYEVRESQGGQVYCTCPAWRFSRPTVTEAGEFKQPCKHLSMLGFTRPHRMEVPSWVFRRKGSRSDRLN